MTPGALIGDDAPNQQFVMNAFDSIGFHRIYKGTVRDGAWKFAGESERVTFTFSDEGETMRTKWERSDSGWNRQPLCEIKETKVSKR